MKLVTALSIATITALLIGCGGGGGGSTPTDSTTTSSTGTTGTSSSSSVAQSGTSQERISSSNLANMTVVAEYQSGPIVQNIEKVSYVFLPNSEAIVVFDLFDGSRKVARDSHYYESDGNNVALLNLAFDDGESFGIIIAAGISSPGGIDLITVGESTAFPYTVTAILGNAENGIDENSVTTVNVSSSSSSADSNSPLATATSITIYNNSSKTEIDKTEPTFSYSDFTRYDSNTPLHCIDYGFTSPIIDNTDKGVHSLSYMEGGRSCFEIDYENSSISGNANAAFYK
jgi:hypothetical protein